MNDGNEKKILFFHLPHDTEYISRLPLVLVLKSNSYLCKVGVRNEPLPSSGCDLCI